MHIFGIIYHSETRQITVPTKNHELLRILVENGADKQMKKKKHTQKERERAYERKRAKVQCNGAHHKNAVELVQA